MFETITKEKYKFLFIDNDETDNSNKYIATKASQIIEKNLFYSINIIKYVLFIYNCCNCIN